MLSDILQVNDIGVALTVKIVQNDGQTPINLSSFTSPTIYVTRSDGTLITGVATFTTDGSDGLIQYVTQVGDLSIPGIYKIQASYLVSGSLKHASKDVFVVDPNLVGVN